MLLKRLSRTGWSAVGYHIELAAFGIKKDPDTHEVTDLSPR